jgi:hypothetical protein
MLWAHEWIKISEFLWKDRTEKGAIMNEGVRNQLEAKLKKMLDEAEAKEKKPKIPSGTGNIIRRRAGEKEKRFLSESNPDCG